MYPYLKRAFDFTAALLLLIVISPVFLVLYFMVVIKLGRPAYFKQKRTGLHGRVFYIIKFRTMLETRDANGEYLPDDKRMTAFGNFLRGSSLDELPELFNIIKGDMAVIGPRPLPPSYDEYYTDFEKDRLGSRGGLIPPEVLYRDIKPTWDNQLRYEADYVHNLSLLLDIRIMFTVFKGLFSRYNSEYGDFVRLSLAEERKVHSEVEEKIIK